MHEQLALQIAQFRDRATHRRELAQSTTSYRVQDELLALAQSYERDVARIRHGAPTTGAHSTV